MQERQLGTPIPVVVEFQADAVRKAHRSLTRAPPARREITGRTDLSPKRVRRLKTAEAASAAAFE